MKYEIYKERYEFEWNHRTHLMDATNISIAATAIVGSGLVAQVQSFKYLNLWLLVFFMLFIFASSICLLVSIYCIYKSISGFRYAHIATPNQLNSHYNLLKNWCIENNRDINEADILLQDFITEKTGEAIEHNLENNKFKSAHNQRSIIATFLSLALLIVATVPYLASVLTADPNTQDIKPANSIKLSGDLNMTTSDQNSSPQNTQPTPTPVPPGPANTLIQEHKVKVDAVSTGNSAK